MTDAAFPICLPGISPTRAYFIQHGYVAKIESLKNKNSKLHKLVHELQKKAVAQGRQISQLEELESTSRASNATLTNLLKKAECNQMDRATLSRENQLKYSNSKLASQLDKLRDTLRVLTADSCITTLGSLTQFHHGTKAGSHRIYSPEVDMVNIKLEPVLGCISRSLSGHHDYNLSPLVIQNGLSTSSLSFI